MARKKPKKNQEMKKETPGMKNKTSEMKKFYPALALIVLVIFVAAFLQLSQNPKAPLVGQPSSQAPSSNQSKPPQKQGGAGFSFQVIPLRDSFYTGGRVVTLVSIVSNQTQNYYLSGEWTAYEEKLNKTIAIPESRYNDTFFLQKNQIVGQYRWNSISENATNAIFLAKVSDDSGRSFTGNISVKLIKNDENIPYLAENSVVKSNDTATIFALNNLRGVNPIDFDQAAALFGVTRNYLSSGPEMNETDSLKVFDEKKGDSLGYSSFYAMLLRSVGIPAKVMRCTAYGRHYFYDEVLVSGRGWLKADVYNSSQSLGESANLCQNATPIY